MADEGPRRPVLSEEPGINKIKLDFKFVKINNIKQYLNFIFSRPVGRRPAMEQSGDKTPAWLAVLDEEDLQFLRRFVLSSGSLKALAQEYGVSYPTVRARLDRLIAKVQAAEDPKVRDPFERKLRVLVADAQIAPALAKELLEAHRASPGKRGEK